MSVLRRGLWSPQGLMRNNIILSYLISSTASLLQRFPSKFSDKIPLRTENHNSGVGHHNLSLQLNPLCIISVQNWIKITRQVTQTLIRSFNSNFSPIFLLIFLERKRQKTIRTFVGERLGAN